MNFGKRVNTSEAVAKHLMRLINDGTFPPGAKLPSEFELMKQLDIGRSTLREAMRGLSMLDVVEVQPGKGTFIKKAYQQTPGSKALIDSINRVKLEELLEARLIIEPEICALAAAHATSDDIAFLQGFIDRIGSSEEPETLRKATLELHSAISEISGNEVLGALSEELLSQIWIRQAGFYNVVSKEEAIESHQLLVNGIASRSPGLAAETMKYHLRHSHDIYLSLNKNA